MDVAITSPAAERLNNILDQIASDDIFVHILPAIEPGTYTNTPSVIHCHRDQIRTEGDHLIINGSLPVDQNSTIDIAGDTPLAGPKLDSARTDFYNCVYRMLEESGAEGLDGIVVGYDPTIPSPTIPTSDFGMTDECVFDWSRPRGAPELFCWADVVAVLTDELSARVYLTDGRAVFLHANIDWMNRLS